MFKFTLKVIVACAWAIPAYLFAIFAITTDDDTLVMRAFVLTVTAIITTAIACAAYTVADKAEETYNVKSHEETDSTEGKD